jgi:hypothetical protein
VNRAEMHRRASVVKPYPPYSKGTEAKEDEYANDNPDVHFGRPLLRLNKRLSAVIVETHRVPTIDRLKWAPFVEIGLPMVWKLLPVGMPT